MVEVMIKQPEIFGDQYILWQAQNLPEILELIKGIKEQRPELHWYLKQYHVIDKNLEEVL